MLIAQYIVAAVLLILAALLTRDIGKTAAVRLEIAIAIMIAGGLLLLAATSGWF